MRASGWNWKDGLRSLFVGVLALVLLLAGSLKLLGNPGLASDFARWGYAGWFMTLTGALEVVAAATLSWRRTRPAGALLAAAILLGALATHARHGEWLPAVPATLLLVATAFVWRQHVRGGTRSELRPHVHSAAAPTGERG